APLVSFFTPGAQSLRSFALVAPERDGPRTTKADRPHAEKWVGSHADRWAVGNKRAGGGGEFG
ncbi:hypothetical protein, partial [Nocardia sp. NPDC019395]|uniref:hypothetical protein n=1 Tax=Nocardia sp. NPDC019395 TaxID=3154686 RepID=UPI00340C46AD